LKIWSACNGPDHIKNISGKLFRLVESQEQVATMGYVDTLEEQALLEDMLEEIKPPYPVDMRDYHYLLTTAFRYPPLKWGSRFGKISEPSLFYGGCNPQVTLAESAYYRFVFLSSMEGVSNTEKIRSEHLMYDINYRTNMGVVLQSTPFNQYRADIKDPQRYSISQQLGSDMRHAGVIAFEYESARENGCCVGLFNVSAFSNRKPNNETQWLCETTLQEVSFKTKDNNAVYHFPITVFLIDGFLPLPA
jgi:hypothetical protein